MMGIIVLQCMEDNISIEDIKNSVIIIALDNLSSLCEQALENKEITTQEEEYYSLLRDISKDILRDMGIQINQPHVIPRPKWNQQD